MTPQATRVHRPQAVRRSLLTRLLRMDWRIDGDTVSAGIVILGVLWLCGVAW